MYSPFLINKKYRFTPYAAQIFFLTTPNIVILYMYTNQLLLSIVLPSQCVKLSTIIYANWEKYMDIINVNCSIHMLSDILYIM